MGYLSVIILSKTKSNWSFVVKNIKIKRKAIAMKHYLSNLTDGIVKCSNSILKWEQ